MPQYRQLKITMETRDHSKNGASSKSHTNRGNFLKLYFISFAARINSTTLIKATTLAVLIAFMALSSCKQSSSGSTSLSIEAETWLGYDYAMTNPSNSQFEYVVKVTVRNTGKAAIEWSEIRTEFYPEGGHHLTTSSFAFDPEKGLNQANYQQGDATSKLKPGETFDFEARTNGYTNKILRDANGESIKFAVTVFHKGKPIIQPSVVQLPALGDLSRDRKEAVKLQF